MKWNIPILPLTGLIIVALMAVIAKFVTDVPPVIENGAYIIGIILVIAGNLITISKNNNKK